MGSTLLFPIKKMFGFLFFFMQLIQALLLRYLLHFVESKPQPCRTKMAQSLWHSEYECKRKRSEILFFMQPLWTACGAADGGDGTCSEGIFLMSFQTLRSFCDLKRVMYIRRSFLCLT